MRALKAVVVFVDWFFAIAAGIFALMWIITGFFKSGTTWPVSGDGVAVLIIIVVAFVLVVLNALLAADVLARAFGVSYLKLEGAGGRVNVSVRALQEALERAVKDIAEVTAARVRIQAPRKKGRPVIIHSFVNLKGSVVYHSISRSIINVMESSFSDIVSEGTPVECHVFWEKIRQDAPAVSQAAPPSESLRPRFPVEQEQESKE